MTIRFEKKFKLEDVINKEEEYHLWIISMGIARQDLYFDIGQMKRIIDSDSQEGLFYFTKLSISHVNEVIALLKRAFEKYPVVFSQFTRIDNFLKEYTELLELCEGNDNDSFFRRVLSEARNNFFHYNKGNWNDRKKEYDFESTKKILESLYREKFFTGYKIGDSIGENDFYFADDIQINWLFEIGKEYQLNESDLLEKISEITSKTMKVLTIVIDDFFINKTSKDTGFNIRYRR